MSPEQLLQTADDVLLKSREAEVEKLQVLLAWADWFSGDPQDEPNAVPVRYGGPRLISWGGEGTPKVSDLALVEMAIARRESVFTTRRRLADAFDLRHRLPLVWAGLQALRCETWVGTKVAAMSRKLTLEQVALVDVAVAAALDEAPARILEIAEAKIIEADPVGHRERIDANRARKGVWHSRPKPGDSVEGETAGVGSVFARIDEVDLEAHREFIEELAQALAANAPAPVEGEEPLSMDHWRAEAFAMLADPAAVLAFLRGETEQTADAPTDESTETPEAPEAPAASPAATPAAGPTATVVVHVAQDPDTGALGPVARVEGLGPRLLSQVRDLLRRHANVTVTPVIDLHTGRSVNGYEHPTDVKTRTELRTLGDVFPHAVGLFTRTGRPPDHDHTVPYDKNGPSGQTGDHNDTPLRRHHHRAKTHAGYSVHQLGPDRWIWRTPHGLHRLVTTHGTTVITAGEFFALRLAAA
ncbi:hypothetical protein ASD81_18335 [Nocardioides sp. Root614]|nr:hypothetical protein ASD81_18335 [Nocardioides sp. Root614]KRA88016.1 hypothetical protein ASD84_18610 [Nocardioides sp. Root682]